MTSDFNDPGSDDPVGAPMQVKPTIVGPSAFAAEGGHYIKVSADEKPTMEKLLEIAERKDIGDHEKRARMVEIDPDLKLLRRAIETAEAEIVSGKVEQGNRQRLLDSLQRYGENAGPMVLQKNECSRLHKLLEAMREHLFYDGDERAFMGLPPGDPGLEDSMVIVVRHDWAAALGNNFSFTAEDPFRLPYKMCEFEFRIDNHTVIQTLRQKESEPGIETTTVIEGVDGVWFTLGLEAMQPLADFCERQVRAICIALEAKVAEHEVMRAPTKLNAKRIKDGKVPIRDFHIVDLARRIRQRSRAEARQDAQPTGRRVRLHFRRGHWRHFESHKTWIEWMLVGDPDLGFIDKHYRI